MNTLTTELRVILGHLDAHPDLPEAASVQVGRYQHGTLSVQLHQVGLPAVASALVAWADTLTDPTGEVWYVPTGHSVHLAIFGGLPGGLRLRVFDAVAPDVSLFGAELEPGGEQSLSLPVLRTWAAQGVTA